jgi:hypothetical protein
MATNVDERVTMLDLAVREGAVVARPAPPSPFCSTSTKDSSTCDGRCCRTGPSDRRRASEGSADFAREADVVLVFVLERSLPAGASQSAALAGLLDRWVQEHPDPYLGAHWPT